MKETIEVEYCKNMFFIKSRREVEGIIESSNLTNRERELVKLRYIEGLRVKEICEVLKLEECTYKKLHRKILSKLYIYITLNGIG